MLASTLDHGICDSSVYALPLRTYNIKSLQALNLSITDSLIFQNHNGITTSNAYKFKKCDAQHKVVKLQPNLTECSGWRCSGNSGLVVTPWHSFLLLGIWYLRSLLSDTQFTKRFPPFHEQATINNGICVRKPLHIHLNVDFNVWMRACVLILMQDVQKNTHKHILISFCDIRLGLPFIKL